MASKAEQAIALHDKGYNCAQAVLCTYCDAFGVDVDTAYKMSEGFGLGMGLMEVCGALSAVFMLAGLKNSAGTDAPGTTKAAVYAGNRALAEQFRAISGTYLCRELKGVTDGKVRRACPDCIRDACKLVEQEICK